MHALVLMESRGTTPPDDDVNPDAVDREALLYP
jgi:hypothetical protein